MIDAHGDMIITWKTDLAGIDALTRGRTGCRGSAW